MKDAREIKRLKVDVWELSELKAALDDIAKIRKAKSPSEKRNIGIILRAALWQYSPLLE